MRENIGAPAALYCQASKVNRRNMPGHDKKNRGLGMRLFGRGKRDSAAAKKSYVFTTDWFCGNEERFQRFLSPLADSRCSILEIGAFEGRSTCWLLDNIAAHPESTVTSIDPFPTDHFHGNVALSKNASKHKFYQGKSVDVMPRLNDSKFDFVYIDGSHTSFNVLADAVMTFEKTKVGGIMAFDDYEWTVGEPDGTTPKIAIDVFRSVFCEKIALLEKGYQVWFRKIAS